MDYQTTMTTATVAVFVFLVSSTGERGKRGTQCGEIDLEQVSPANTTYPVPGNPVHAGVIAVRRGHRQ